MLTRRGGERQGQRNRVPRAVLLTLPNQAFTADQLQLWLTAKRSITLAEASISSDLSTWTATRLTPASLGGGEYSLTESTDGADTDHHIEDSVADAVERKYTASIALKNPGGGRDWARLYVDDGATAADCYFDVANGTVGTATGCTGSISGPDADGYYTCTITGTADNTSVMRVYPAIADNDFTYTGDGRVAFRAKEVGYIQVRASGLADQSGDGHNASQATPSLQPLYGPNARGEKRYIDFDGTDDGMLLDVSGGWSPRTSHSLFVLVNRRDATTTQQYLLDSENTGSGRIIFRLVGTASDRIGWFDGSSRQVIDANTGWAIYEWHLDGDATTGKIIRSTATTSTSLGTATYSPVPLDGAVGLCANFVAGSDFANCQLGPMVLASFASGTATEAQREQIRKYLRYWAAGEGITLA